MKKENVWREERCDKQSATKAEEDVVEVPRKEDPGASRVEERGMGEDLDAVVPTGH